MEALSSRAWIRQHLQGQPVQDATIPGHWHHRSRVSVPGRLWIVVIERREGYDILIQSLDQIRREVGAEPPRVATTDFEVALRSAIMEVLPSTQLQLCIFHINANVDLNVKRKWEGPGAPDDTEFEVDQGGDEALQPSRPPTQTAPASAVHTASAHALNELGRANRVLTGQQLTETEVEHSPAGFSQLWA